MTRRWMTFILTLAMALALTAHAQTTHEVNMLIEPVEGRAFPAFYFEPTGLYVEPGDTVRFVAVTPHHTVTAYHPAHGYPQRVPDGVGPFSSPVIPVGETWEHTFETPGVYDIWCAPHEVFGMVMRVVVGEATGPATEPMSATEFGTPANVLNDPALAPERIVVNGSVSWTEIADASKALPPFLQNVEMPADGN